MGGEQGGKEAHAVGDDGLAGGSSTVNNDHLAGSRIRPHRKASGDEDSQAENHSHGDHGPCHRGRRSRRNRNHPLVDEPREQRAQVHLQDGSHSSGAGQSNVNITNNGPNNGQIAGTINNVGSTVNGGGLSNDIQVELDAIVNRNTSVVALYLKAGLKATKTFTRARVP